MDADSGQKPGSHSRLNSDKDFSLNLEGIFQDPIPSVTNKTVSYEPYHSERLGTNPKINNFNSFDDDLGRDITFHTSGSKKIIESSR